MDTHAQVTVGELISRIEALEAQLEATRRHAVDDRGRIGAIGRPSRRALGLLVGVVLMLVMAVPVVVFASHRYTDVPTSSTFHADIDAIAAVGVTTGCAVGKYCPKDFVTREQMAAFLNRLGALGPGKTPVVNATKLDGKDSTEFLASNGKAADSERLDGLNSTAFLGAGAKAADSDLLDGLNATAFLLAAGKAADSELLDGLNSTAFLGAGAKAADSELLDGLDSTAFPRVIASGSQAVDLGSITALTCAATNIGSADSHGNHVLVNNPYDEAAITSAPTLLDVFGVRVTDGGGDDIWIKVCNRGAILPIDPGSVTFDWTLLN